MNSGQEMIENKDNKIIKINKYINKPKKTKKKTIMKPDKLIIQDQFIGYSESIAAWKQK